jgi:hypothetical protein
MAQILAETGDGLVEFEVNELTIKSKYEDPPKLRHDTVRILGVLFTKEQLEKIAALIV